MKCGNDMMFQM